MKRFFLDANVLFSAAHNPGGNARALFRLAAAGRIALVCSRYAMEEAARNIALKFPGCGGEFEALAGAMALVPEPSEADVALARSYGLPDKDAPILAAAVSAAASMLVTGDRRDFGHLFGKTVEGVEIVTPADAVLRAVETTSRRR